MALNRKIINMQNFVLLLDNVCPMHYSEVSVGTYSKYMHNKGVRISIFKSWCAVQNSNKVLEIKVTLFPKIRIEPETFTYSKLLIIYQNE